MSHTDNTVTKKIFEIKFPIRWVSTTRICSDKIALMNDKSNKYVNVTQKQNQINYMRQANVTKEREEESTKK